MGAMKDRAGPQGLTIVSDDSNIPVFTVLVANMADWKMFMRTAKLC